MDMSTESVKETLGATGTEEVVRLLEMRSKQLKPEPD